MRKDRIYFLLILLAMGLLAYFLVNRQEAKSPPVHIEQPENKPEPGDERGTADPPVINDIKELTAENTVVAHVKKNNRLPGYYITKSEARKQGWNAGQGNLCDVLPGRAIGGDLFTNRQKALPVRPGRTWYEADLNYDCGRRNADRLLFSSDGLVFVTHDHYKTFQQK